MIEGSKGAVTLCAVPLLGRIGLALVSALLALGACEIAVRVFDLAPRFHVVLRERIQPSTNPVLGYELRPGAPDGKRFRINAAGLRDRDHSRAKPAGVFRIAALGDSVTFGSGVQRDRGWVDVLEGLLARGASPVEVLNFGVPGYHVGQIAESLGARALAYEPDLVLYAYVLNDPQATSIEARALETAPSGSPGASVPRLVRRALSHSQLFLWARWALQGRGASAPVDPLFEALQADGLADYVRALHTEPGSRRRVEAGLHALARKAGARPRALVVFPVFPDDGLVRYPLADVHDWVAERARSEGFAVIDLRAPLAEAARREPGRRLHVDVLHPNAAGHRIAALAILQGLCEARLLPPAARCPVSPGRP